MSSGCCAYGLRLLSCRPFNPCISRRARLSLLPYSSSVLGQLRMATSEAQRASTRERTRRWRARQRDPLHAPPVRLPGRRPHAGAMGCKTVAQRRRRRRVMHKSLLVRCLQQLLRLKVLPRRNLENCSNVQALLRLEPLLRERS